MSMLPVAVMAALSGVAGTTNPIPQENLANPHNCFRLQYENDAMFDRDENYSHGTRLDYTHSSGWRHGFDMGWGVSLSQNIYTPVTHTSHAVPGEHPYAGFMALGGALYMRCDEGIPFGTLWELQVGTTGEPALSHGVQHGLHELCDMKQWKGWHDQVPAEPLFQLSQIVAVDVGCVSRSYGYWETQGMAFGRYELGTLFISGGAGAVFRVGHNLPDSMVLHGNRSANYGVGLVAKNSRMEDYDPDALSYYLSAGVMGEYVARDFSIDGGVFRHFDNKTCGRQQWQIEARLGVGVTYKGIEYYMGAAAHSKTYRTQDTPGVYGTFSISWRW